MDSELIETVKEHLLEKAGMPNEKLVDFLKETSVYLKGIMDALDEGIDEGRFEIVVSSAHTLKGSLSNLGLEELSQIAGNLEAAAVNTSPLYLSCYHMRLRKGLITLLDYADKN
ncbi:Hpt domain-containing protein [Desulfovibrio sp. JC022]|uniref:Hpt domain-containing protein n=1 Tax=Desulfovibrio sp. JC022 TaxID=2593642 RepID=UPI0013D34BE8|nr:Hpt domain-containing protein [Desulfovibrio sp. JC022]NDV21962.1 phosphotransferase [Desulfovibrio sp. JC022]